jgi:two-component system NtrC family sensor kinase
MMVDEYFKKGEMSRSWSKFDGIMALVTLTGAITIGLSIIVIGFLESRLVDQVGADDRQGGFVRISELIAKTGGIKNLTGLQELMKEVRELRPGIKRLSVFELSSDSASLVLTTDPENAPRRLDPQEQTQIVAGRSVMQLDESDESSEERAWRITAPIIIDGKVVGALRGLYSAKPFDDLLKQEISLTKEIGLGAVIVTSLVFVVLVRFGIHRPMHRLLYAMRKVEAGNLSSEVSIEGPVEIKELTTQFNRMLSARRRAWSERDHLLVEVQHLNETLQQRVTDATDELQQANLKLVEARLAVERSQRVAALGELSASVAHELGNPLNALSGHLQMLTHTSHSASRERHLAVIRSEVDRMVAIIKQLLGQTRIHLESAPVSLNSLIHEVVALLAPGLPLRQITLKTDLGADLPPIVGDPHALHGLVFNLINNAKQAMPSGGELTIRTRTVDGEELPGTIIVSEGALVNGTAVRLAIADTGYGIHPEQVSRIFKPFFTTRHDQGGTGLGLAICHRVVTDNGGRLAVKSEVGQGTQFTVDLPIWKG